MPRTLRIRVPTVLHATMREHRPQPRVGLVYDDDAWQLSVAESERAEGWMRAAAAWLESRQALAAAEGLALARDVLESKPPRVVEQRSLGVVEAHDSGGDPLWVEVALETALVEAMHPRLVLHVAERPDELESGDTWWLLPQEGERLVELLASASGGVLEEVGPNRRPWLHVTPRDGGVTLRFDDDVIDERGDDGVVELDATAVERLRERLRQAVELERTTAPYVYVPPEPDELMLVEIPLD
jgi:hypothetical protein